MGIGAIAAHHPRLNFLSDGNGASLHNLCRNLHRLTQLQQYFVDFPGCQGI